MSRINAVYYPSWRVYRDVPPSALPLQYVTHVFYAFVRPNADGTLRLLDEWADEKKPVDGFQGCLAATAALKQASPRLQALISVGGGGSGGSDAFPALAASPRSRAAFAESCRRFVDRHGFDGVDIDWEHPQTPEQGRDYLALLRELRRCLPAGEGYRLTTALPTGEYVLRHIDLGAAAEVLDLLNLMCYDFAGPWTKTSGHHAQLLPSSGGGAHGSDQGRSGDRGVRYLVEHGFPARKIVFGIPAYARSFAGADGPGQAFQSAAEHDYNELDARLVAEACVDSSVGAASLVDPARGFVSLDVPATVRQKAEYARRTGLAGLFYWTGAGDVRVGPASLVRAGYEALNAERPVSVSKPMPPPVPSRSSKPVIPATR